MHHESENFIVVITTLNKQLSTIQKYWSPNFFGAVRGEYERTQSNGANEYWIQLCAVACGGAGTKLQHAAHCQFIVSLLLLTTLVHSFSHHACHQLFLTPALPNSA